MKRRIGKLLSKLRKTSLILLAFIILILALSVYYVTTPWPQDNGVIKLPGLLDRVEVFRNEWGIPHIYARNSHDLFMAQGYIHAQDRFWQMDFWRHMGAGRLSEMFGDSQVTTDKFLRTLGFTNIAKKELEQLDPNTVSFLESYSQGVNAYLSRRHSYGVDFKYTLLNLVNPEYKIESWNVINSLTWSKVMAWRLSKNISSELERSILHKSYPKKRISELFPSYPDNHPVIDSNLDLNFTNSDSSKGSELPYLLVNYFSAWNDLTEKIQDLDRTFSVYNSGSNVGSNNWIISGQRTSSGKPILANDIHLSAQMPSIWYEVGLHCIPKDSSCPFEITGFSFASVPGVLVGHNDNIAWGMTNLRADVMDLYIEKINPKDPNKYATNGSWKNMHVVKDEINVAGSDSIELTRRYTSNGPIISDTYKKLEDFTEKSGINSSKHYAIALKWTALEPSTVQQAIFRLMQASNWEDFRDAAKRFDIINQNVGYADIEGNIGYQMVGNIPVRLNGKGKYPVIGGSVNFGWQNYIPFDDLPFIFNPSQGYIVTANNAVIRPDSNYPYLISSDWSQGYRAKRISKLIEKRANNITVNYAKKMQSDNKALNAKKLVSILLDIPISSRLQKYLNILSDWDFRLNKNTPKAALFESFWKHLLENTFYDELPEKYYPNGGSRWFKVVEYISEKKESFWWDNQNTSVHERRDDIFRKAFMGAVNELSQKFGKNYRNWKWGDLHTITFRDQSLGKSGNPLLNLFFNRGPFPVSGSNSTVKATGWRPANSFEANWLPTMRMIVDLDNLQNSFSVNSTGQSGHAFHTHYDDLIYTWLEDDYHPMQWKKSIVKERKSSLLTFTP